TRRRRGPPRRAGPRAGSGRDERREAPGALEDRGEPALVGDARVALAEPAERLRVVLLRLLRERPPPDRAGELLRAGCDRRRVGERPREEDGAHLVAEERQERRLEGGPRLELARRLGRQHALDPGERARRARPRDRARRRVDRALVELGSEAEV